MMHGKIGVSEHAEGHSGCAFRFGPVAAQVKDGQMTRADEFDGTIVYRAAHNQGGILPGQRASMLMSHLHATFRSLARVNLPLQRMVEAANRVFSESTLAGQYSTLRVGRAI